MRNKLTFSMLALGVLTGGLLTSCSVDSEPTIDKNNGMLLKAPKVIAYSGNHTWNAGTRGTDMNANMWDQNWDCPPRPAQDLTPEELAELKELLSKGVETHNNIVLPFENYYVQQIYKGEDRYNTHDRCFDEGCNHVNGQTELGSDHMDKLVAYNPSEVFDYRQEDNWQGAWYTSEYEHVNNFNSGTNNNTPGACGCGQIHSKTTLMTDMPTSGIDPERQFGFHENWGTSHDYNNYIIVEYKGYYYVGFDFEAHKYDQTTHNHGEGLDIERDWNFTDWIVRITPAYHKGETPEGNPGGVENPGVTPPGGNEGDNGNDEDICDDCEHNAHGDEYCPDCGEDEGCNKDNNVQPNPDDETPETPGDDVAKGYDEVEINLALDEKDNKDILESHLSMHVRSATDVKVFIPVPAQYYCEADDMAIVMDHKDAFVHGGPYQTVYEINGNIVTLNVEFSDEGITIWTDGINQDVIDYCWETYGDGITFEVWNYFNNPETEELLSMEDLKYLLNHATVEFLDKVPGKYINSFGKEHGKYENEDSSTHGNNDFHVTPVKEQEDNFDGPEVGEHLNGSSNNDIYTNKNKTKE